MAIRIKIEKNIALIAGETIILHPDCDYEVRLKISAVSDKEIRYNRIQLCGGVLENVERTEPVSEFLYQYGEEIAIAERIPASFTVKVV